MPRTARLALPDLLQHVIVRGVNRCDIFLNDADRERFLQNLSKLLVQSGTECFAWALMTNHVHLLLRPRNTLLAPFMRRLLTGYAIYFNLRHNGRDICSRTGISPLFAKRMRICWNWSVTST